MMKKMVRCKACGYVMQGDKYDECPACGVPAKMFEPYDDKVPENRHRVLDFHLHGVIVHAPQGVGFINLVLAAILLFITLSAIGSGMAGTTAQIHTYIAVTLQVMSIILPVVVAAGMGSGLIDGKYRYKKVTTKLLVKKIILGSLFLVFSVVMLIIAIQPGFPASPGLQFLYLLSNGAAFTCSAILGRWGESLIHGIMPGPFMKKKKAAAPATVPAAPAGPEA